MGLRRYMAKRAVDSLVTVFIVFLLNFFICYQRLEEAWGVFETDQFTNYLRFVFVDKFGAVLRYSNTLEYILELLPYSLLLLIVSAFLAILVGVAFGALASYKRGSKVDLLILAGFVILIMTPNWWSAFFMLANLTPWFPAGKWHSYYWSTTPFLADPLGKMRDFMWHATLPIVSLMLSVVGIYFIVSRNSMLSTFDEPYIITAKAKGVKSRTVVLKHALRNAIIPIATSAAIAPVFLINACISVERVYSLNGLGTALYDSVVTRFGSPRYSVLPTLPAIFFLLSLVTIAIHYCLDVLSYHLDPRLRKSMTDGAGLLSFSESLRWKSRKKKIKVFLASFTRGFSGKIGLVIILILVCFAVLAPFLPLKDPELPDPTTRNQPPSLEHLFGTDEHGRDVLSRTIWATQVSLVETLGALAIAILVGTFVGMLSGYYRDQPIAYLLDRLTDVFLSVPLIIVALFFPIETGSLRWIISVGLSTWAIVAKVVRSQVLVTREKAYVESAKAVGVGKARTFLNYVLPDTIGVIAANMLYIAGIVVLIQTSLEFFGFKRFLFSKDPELRPVTIAPALSWGSMLSFNLPTFLSIKTWWVVAPPLICLILLGLSLVLIGNKITEVMNPQIGGHMRF